MSTYKIDCRHEISRVIEAIDAQLQAEADANWSLNRKQQDLMVRALDFMQGLDGQLAKMDGKKKERVRDKDYLQLL